MSGDVSSVVGRVGEGSGEPGNGEEDDVEDECDALTIPGKPCVLPASRKC